MNQYRFAFDESYAISSVSSYRRQRKVYPWFIAVKVVCFLGLAALLALIVVAAVGQAHTNSATMLLVSLVPALFIVLLLMGPRLDYLVLKRRLKKSPFYGEEVQFAVADAGVSVNTPKSQSSLSWSAFTAAKRVSSGYLLFSGPTVFHWLPDEALTGGSVADVQRLLQHNIRTYEGTAA